MSELDVELQDNELIAEIALVAELMVMATEAPGACWVWRLSPRSSERSPRVLFHLLRGRPPRLGSEDGNGE
jgi:hypothetical protein